MMMCDQVHGVMRKANPSSPPPPSRLSPLVAKQYSRRGDKVNRNGYRRVRAVNGEAVEGVGIRLDLFNEELCNHEENGGICSRRRIYLRSLAALC